MCICILEVKNATEAFQGHTRADDEHVVKKEIQRRGEFFSRLQWMENEVRVCANFLAEEEGAAVALRVERVWRGDVNFPPLAGPG